MIRQPSTAAQLFAWWRSAVADPETVRHDGLPECGWFKRRFVKGGPWVPVRIFVRREIDPETGELSCPETLVADVDGKLCDPATHWTHLTAISREEYDALLYRASIIPGMADNRKKLDLAQGPLQWMT